MYIKKIHAWKKGAVIIFSFLNILKYILHHNNHLLVPLLARAYTRNMFMKCENYDDDHHLLSIASLLYSKRYLLFLYDIQEKTPKVESGCVMCMFKVK